ncbi:MAG: hypothetical protein M1839_002718, partial [Geoglossum umbratile]
GHLSRLTLEVVTPRNSVVDEDEFSPTSGGNPGFQKTTSQQRSSGKSKAFEICPHNPDKAPEIQPRNPDLTPGCSRQLSSSQQPGTNMPESLSDLRKAATDALRTT